MRTKQIKSGVQFPEWVPKIVKAVAPMVRMEIREVYTQAAVEWLRHCGDVNHAVRVYVEQEAVKNAEIKVALSGKITDIGKKAPIQREKQGG